MLRQSDLSEEAEKLDSEQQRLEESIL